MHFCTGGMSSGDSFFRAGGRNSSQKNTGNAQSRKNR
jgi:hypothetical protein